MFDDTTVNLTLSLARLSILRDLNASKKNAETVQAGLRGDMLREGIASGIVSGFDLAIGVVEGYFKEVK